MKVPPEEVKLSRKDGEALIERLQANTVTSEDRRLLVKLSRLYFWFTFALRETKISLKRLKRALFGGGQPPPSPPTGGGASGSAGGGAALPGLWPRNAVFTAVGVEIRIDGNALLSAVRYELEKLRCSACGEVFTAPMRRRSALTNTVLAPGRSSRWVATTWGCRSTGLSSTKPWSGCR